MQTQAEDLRKAARTKEEVTRRYGAWHAHNIYLQDDLYTIGPRIVGDELKLRRIVQCVLDLAGGSVRGLRIVDLACGEGLYGIELARHGAEVLAIEGREPNVEKVRFVKEALSLDNLEVVQDDVRNLSVEKYGVFDIVLCLGILYHLKAPDVFSFAHRLGDICRRVCIVDTRITLRPKTPFSYDGDTYFGTWGEEHWPGDSREVKLGRLGASLDDEYNFWLSRPSVYNLLYRSGFTSAYECHAPAEPKKPANRVTFVAIKGQPCRLIGAPLMAERPRDTMPEHPLREHGTVFTALRALSHLLPFKARKVGKRLLGLNNELT